MVNIIRRFQKPLMVTITVLVIISFIVFFNKTTVDRTYGGNIGTIYGRPLTMTQLERGMRLGRLAVILRAQDLVLGLLSQRGYMALIYNQLPDEMAREFAVNQMILRHEADRFGIQPTRQEIDEAVKKFPAFSTGGAFDSSKFNDLIANQLAPLGFSSEQIEEIAVDQIRLVKLRDLVAGAIQPSAADIHELYVENFQKTEASFVRFKYDDFKAAIQISDDDAKKLFESKKDTLKTPEKRKVKVAAFIDEKTPAGERGEAYKKLQESAENFSAALLEKDANFEALAAKFGGQVRETPAFAAEEPPAELDKSREATDKAFTLTTKQPYSDPIAATPKIGYYVLKLVDVEAGRQLTFEEAKPKLVEQLQSERAHEALNLKATEVRNKIEAEMKAGKSFADAAQAAGVKAESFPVFSRAERAKSTDVDAPQIMEAAGGMKEGELSPKLIETESGGLLVHVDKRQPVDEADFEKRKDKIVSNLQQSDREGLFTHWMETQQKEAKLHFGRNAE